MVTPDHNPDDDKPLTPEQQSIVAKARWLMLMSGVATFLGIAVVIGLIGYRMFRSDGNAAPREVTALLMRKIAELAPAPANGNGHANGHAAGAANRALSG